MPSRKKCEVGLTGSDAVALVVVVILIVLSLYLSGWFHTIQHLLITSLAWRKTLCLFELAAFQA